MRGKSTPASTDPVLDRLGAIERLVLGLQDLVSNRADAAAAKLLAGVPLTTGEVAALFSWRPQTVRNYVSLGLLPRSYPGRAAFKAEDVRTLPDRLAAKSTAKLATPKSPRT